MIASPAGSRLRHDSDFQREARRVLLVEDNPGDVALISALLKRPTDGPKLELTVANRLAVALEELPRGVALVLLDLRLPDAAGVDVLRRIRAEAQEIPIVVLTGMEDSALARQCLEEGAQDYVRKDDLPGHDLRRAIEFALARVRARELSKRLEHADRLATVGQVAAGVAHEVNNPAAFVYANSIEIDSELERCHSLLANIEQVPPEALTILDNVRGMARDNVDGMERIVSIVRGLTVFSRSKRDQLAPVDVGDLCRSSSNLVLHQIRLRASFELDIQTTPLVLADARKLGQVIVNLLVNATQAITPGGLERDKVVLQTKTDGDRVVISVSDTGRGIDPAHQRRIFEPFFSTKSESEGTGLGLSISRDIVEEHGGTLTVQSTLGEGTTFEIRLPTHDATVAGTARPEAERAVPTRARRRVLLIDDEPQLLRALHRALARTHDVVAAPGGKAGLEAMRDKGGDFDIVLCDLVMPEVDGVDTLQTTEREFPELARHFVLLSGGPPDERAARTLAGRTVVLLQKPIGIRELLEVIDRVTEGARHES